MPVKKNESSIEYLVRRKFPVLEFLRIPTSLNSATRRTPEDREKQERTEALAREYEAELRQLDGAGINALVKEEEDKEIAFAAIRAEQEEKKRSFNQPAASANFTFWSTMPLWTVAEALSLSFGKDPNFVSIETVRPFINVSPFAMRFQGRSQLYDRAQQAKLIPQSGPPQAFIAWASRIQIDYPPELVQRLEALGPQVADWRGLYEQAARLNTNKDQQIASLTAIKDECQIAIVRLTAERDQALLRAQELEANAWEAFDEGSDTYPEELDAAWFTWRAITRTPTKGMTPKEQAKAWLDKNYPKLSNEARVRISKVCNWDKSGGKPNRG